MGNGTSSVNIRLYQRYGSLSGDNYTIEISEEPYKKVENIDKITYKITYLAKQHSYNLVIEHDKAKKPLFTYSSPSTDQNRVNEVHSYYLKTEKRRPLIIGFSTTGKDYNYRFHDLQYARFSKTLDIDRIEYVSDHYLKNILEREVDIIKQEVNVSKNYKEGYGCIYFSNKGDGKKDYKVELTSGVKCTITVTKEPFDNWKYVQCVKYKIIYSGDPHYSTWDNTWYRWSNWYYYLYFYTGTDSSNPGNLIFTYYPRRYYETITEVRAYCYSLYINQPFFITMKTIGKVLYHSSFDDLHRRGSAYNYELSSTFEQYINKMVKDAYEEKFKKVSIKNGNYRHVNIKRRDYEFEGTSRSGSANKYKKFILVSGKSVYSTEDPTIFRCSLFSLNQFKESSQTLTCKNPNFPELGKITNKPIDEKFFKNLTESSHKGVLICYSLPSEIALLVEIHTDCKTKHQFVRKDLDGDTWEKGDHEYDSDGSLSKYLDQVQLNIATRITYMLEMTSNYNDNKVEVTSGPGGSQGYTYYTHVPTQFHRLNSTNVLYNCKKIQIIDKNMDKRQDKLAELSNIVFKEVTMYVLDTNKNDHLIMNLKGNNGKSYCLHRFDKDGVKWIQLSLSEVLELNLINSEVSQLLGSQFKTEDPSTRLSKILKSSYSCIRLLQYISYNLNSIIVLTDYKIGYGNTIINKMINYRKEIPPIDIEKNTITPQEDSQPKFCDKIVDYQIYIHDLSVATMNLIDKASKNQLYIRLYTIYNKILLFEDLKSPTTWLTYKKGCDELFVYFKKGGPKPLLVYYDGCAYGPKWAGARKWYKIKDITNCKLTEQLKQHLNRISGFVARQTKLGGPPGRGGSVYSSNVQRGGESVKSSIKETKPQSETTTSLSPQGSKSRTPAVSKNSSSPPGSQTRKEAAHRDKNKAMQPRGHSQTNSTRSVQPPLTDQTNAPGRGRWDNVTEIQTESQPEDENDVLEPSDSYYRHSEKNQNGSEFSHQIGQVPGSQNNDESFPVSAKAGAGAGGGVFVIGTGVGGYFIYTKYIRPPRL